MHYDYLPLYVYTLPMCTELFSTKSTLVFARGVHEYMYMHIWHLFIILFHVCDVDYACARLAFIFTDILDILIPHLQG